MTEEPKAYKESPKYLTPVQWSRIIAKAWLDEGFKRELLTDTETAIRKHFDFDFNRVIKVPPKPQDLNDEQLEEIWTGDKPAIVIPFQSASC